VSVGGKERDSGRSLTHLGIRARSDNNENLEEKEWERKERERAGGKKQRQCR